MENYIPEEKINLETGTPKKKLEKSPLKGKEQEKSTYLGGKNLVKKNLTPPPPG